MSQVDPPQHLAGTRLDAPMTRAAQAEDVFARQNRLRIARLHELLPASASLVLHQLPARFGLAPDVIGHSVEPPIGRVQAMYAMGSAGTLAQNAESDLDLWLLTHTPDHPTLKSQVAQVTRLCREQGLDLRPHLVNSDRFVDRQVAHSRTNPDDCGTTQRHLLLDEFYRTCVQLAGPRLRWWADASQSDDTVATIDLGELGPPPLSEFVGAAMWHLHKALEAPQKSYIKLLLLEVYATGGPWSLAAAYRDALRHAANTPALAPGEALDPYLFLLEFLAQHLSEPRHRPRLRVARQSLLYRAAVGAHTQPLWRVRLIEQLCEQWDLRSPFLDLASSAPANSAHIPQTLALDVLRTHQTELQQQIERTQTLLRQAGARLPAQSVSREDLQTLSAEVQAGTEALPGKVALLPLPVRKRLPYQPVSLELHENGQWLATQGAGASLLHAPLIPVLCWLARNNFRLDAGSNAGHIELLDRIQSALAYRAPVDLLRPAVPIGGLLLHPISDGDIGTAHDNRASADTQSAWLLLTNSWHEHFLLEVAGADGPSLYS